MTSPPPWNVTGRTTPERMSTAWAAWRAHRAPIEAQIRADARDELLHRGREIARARAHLEDLTAAGADDLADAAQAHLDRLESAAARHRSERRAADAHRGDPRTPPPIVTPWCPWDKSIQPISH